jgi:hypothetical protein
LELTIADVVMQKKNITELALLMREKEKKSSELDSDLKNKITEVADLRVYKAKSIDLQLKLEKSEKQMQAELLAQWENERNARGLK